MKKTIAILLALVLVVALFAGCGSSAAPAAAPEAAAPEALSFQGKDPYTEDIKIAFIPMSASGLNMNVNQQAIDAFVGAWEPYGGHVTVTVFDCANDTSTQVSLVSEATVQGFDAIVLEPKDQTALNTVITEAEEAGIVVITENQGADACCTLHVESDSYSAGYVVGQGLIEAMGTSGKICLIDCPAVQLASTTFSKGFKDYLKAYPDVEIVGYENCKSYSQEDAYTIMADMLTKYDEIDAVYAISDDMAAGCIQAIEAAGREGIIVAGSGCKPSGIENIKAGRQCCTSWPDIYTVVTISLNSALQYIQAGVNGYKLGYETFPNIMNKIMLVDASNIDSIAPMTRWPDYQ